MLLISFLVLLPSIVAYGTSTLNYSLLNFQEYITLPLQNYFENPSDIRVDYSNSTEDIQDILSIQFTDRPVIQVSSMSLSAKLPDGSTVDFNSYSIIMEKSIYNYPNKVFLMSGNMVFSVRYQVSNSDNASYVQAFQIANDSAQCSQIEVQQFNSSFYLFASCLYPNSNSTLYLYRFEEARSAYLGSLVYMNSVDLKMSPTCTKTALYAFNYLFLKKEYRNQVLLFCSFLQNPVLATNKNFIFRVEKNRGNDVLVYDSPIIDSKIANCTKNTSLIFQYQKGFISLSEPYLYYYYYNAAANTTYCSRPFLNVKDLKYLASIEEKGIQYIYVIFQEKIMVKESYSPNYQLTFIDPDLIQNLQLVDYSIASRFLALLYENGTDYTILAFDLHSNYPKLVDVLHYPRNYTFLHLFSVNNYLEMGNYYLIYDAVQNNLALNNYLGYELSIGIVNETAYVGNALLSLTDGAFETLLLHINIRDYFDLTLQKFSGGPGIALIENVLNLNLTDYVIGPLGRFYEYPNNLSAFQYINFRSELNVERELAVVKQNLIALSINNELSTPILTFYFGNRTILTCSLDYSIASERVNMSQCKAAKARANQIVTPLKIVVLVQERYLQFDQTKIELCELSSSGDFYCSKLVLGTFTTPLLDIKVASYDSCDKYEDLFFIVYSLKEVKYVEMYREYPNKNYTVFINYHVGQSSMPDLVDKSIVELKFDEEYTHFLVLWLRSDLDGREKVVVFDKPEILPGSSSNLIGHVIEVFEDINLEAMFCINNLLVLVTADFGGYTIREYKISKEYRLRFIRTYPLYEFKVVMGGRHVQNQNFIFLEITEQGANKYLVYSPLLPSCNLLTHKIELEDQRPLFSQQVDPISNSSLFMLGRTKLVGIALPNFIFKYLTHKGVGEVYSNSFNISVVDNYQTLTILNYNFTRDQTEGNIFYIGTGSYELALNLDYTHTQTEFYIESRDYKGIVADYNLSLPDSPECKGLTLERKDIFTRKQCLIYYQSQQLGTITDFVSYSMDDTEVQVVVTDSNLFCVKNRTMPSAVNENFTNLTECRFSTLEKTVLMTCMNSNSQSREIFLIGVSFSIKNCFVSYSAIDIPEEFAYQDFDLMFTDQYIVFEVPIRTENNKIYEKTRFKDLVINNSYSLLRKEETKGVFRTEFSTIDTFLSEEIFLLLEDGIGIYNVSDSALSLSPALWISRTYLSQKLGNDEPLAYIKYIGLNQLQEQSVLTVELGSIWRSLDVSIVFTMGSQSTSEQTVYELVNVFLDFEYEQYVNCQNSGHSQSQRYQNLIVKICDYQPMVYSVFANFIAINNDSTNSLIQFYNRSGSKYPIRIDTIHSNTLSSHTFLIRNNTLVVGSLFNLLCYYELTPTLSWVIKHEHSEVDQSCVTNLTIFNRQFTLDQPLTINYDGDSQHQQYWSISSLYIQRAVLVVILLNTIRLLAKRWRSSKNRTKRKESNNSTRLYSNRFEVMVKLNSKKTI